MTQKDKSGSTKLAMKPDEASIPEQAGKPAHGTPEPRKAEPKQAKDTGEPDAFLLERLFPDADEVFRPSSDPDPKGDCIIALDTNALLLPYSVARHDLTALDAVYSTIASEGRLVIPERVAREFITHRDRKLADMVQAIGDLRSRINIGENRISPLLEELDEAKSLAKASIDLAAAKKAYVGALDGLVSQIRSWRGNDPVTSLYASLFTKERMARPADAAEKLQEAWTYRVRNKVPPGYKDGGKDDTGIGDFTIWMSLLYLGKTHKKDLIFVTGEEKADWFVKSGGSRVYPRPELVDEYRRASDGRTLKLSSLYDLLREMSAPEGLVRDVQAAEFTANTVIQASAKGGAFASSIHTSFSVETALFDYSTKDGKMRVEWAGKAFDLKFSKASDTSIHLCRSGSTRRVARVKMRNMHLPTTMDRHESSSNNYTIQLGEGFLVENETGDVLAGRVVGIKDDTRGADHDEVEFVYAVHERGTRGLMP